jgi:hypothetical protein
VKSFLKWQLFFVGKKKRPAEALFLPYKKKADIKKLVTDSWISF